ncbi:DUF1403 family protein [Rhodovulum marinum]|uniref:Uncharacterized protein DUF1403 n=1 Tax=Rhodovulum marinum TaxID=320662 RepID=A0A4R2PWK4_9RHOB|nr:DUF1403 family protein [Rhodovulum marinum]TCP39548.1 uncharacterized protein DUF1403 [Rhodovulum marinum]
MQHARPTPARDPESLPRMPAWVTRGGGQSAEDVAFRSGAALATLDLVAGSAEIPLGLLRDRLALAAAEACVARAGRPERARDLRDAVHLLRPGGAPGPAGAVFALWRRAVRVPLCPGLAGLRRLVPEAAGAAMSADAAGQGAVTGAAAVLAAVLPARPQEEDAALILADATLAHALGWPHMLPLLATGLKRRDLALTGADLHRACHRAALSGAVVAHRTALDLARRAAHLRAVAPRLRAKGAAAAVALFLAEDALAPGLALSPVVRGSRVSMSDRAARRLCDRLVALGALRELTGRPEFRLYGL